MRFSTLSFGALMLAAPLCLAATPALAQDVPANSTPAASADVPEVKPFTITGGVTGITDYRFRGLTQTKKDVALQGTLNINSALGFYVGTWASTIDGSGKTPLLAGYGDAEVDLYAGYTKTFKNGISVDGGLLYYYYPSALKTQNTDFFEPYASIAYTVGPVTPKIGVKYAWGGQAGLDFTPGTDDNFYGFGELAVAVPKLPLPLTVTGHLGYTKGSLGLANLVATKNNYWDWSLTGEVTIAKTFKAGVSYVDTNITESGGYATRFGRGSTVLGYLTAFF